MTYKFLSFLFFCGVCISTFGQELQSPQISQNAIFANPGLAGSRGCLRINTSISYLNDNNYIAPRYSFQSNDHKFQKNIVNTLVSADALIWKNRIGVAAYVKNETNKLYSQWSYSDSTGAVYKRKENTSTFQNVYAGFMIAPKFYIGAKDIKKPGRTISPAMGLGFKTTQLTYTGNDTLKYAPGSNSTLSDGMHSNYVHLDYLSLGVLYSSPKSYIGLKINFKKFQDAFFLSDASLILAKSFYNKKVSKPNFSFNPQLYIAVPIDLARREYRYNNDESGNTRVLSSRFCMNLDFRYKKILFGSFLNWKNELPASFGLTAGMQTEDLKVTLNYSYAGFNSTGSVNGLFLSANFYIKGKSDRYR